MATKVVVRRLPAQLGEADFWAKLCEGAGQPVGFSLLYYVAGKISRRRGPIPSRGYLSFGSSEAAASFLEVFRRSPPLFGTGAGSASDSPLAELALCQKMFRPKPRRDSRQGTIERDADFKAFVKGLDAAPEKPPDASFDTKEDVPKTAALVEYLRSRKKVRKERMRTDPRRKARDQPAKPTTKEGRGAKKPAAKPPKRKDGAREPAAEARQQRASRATGSDNPRHKEGRKIIARKE